MSEKTAMQQLIDWSYLPADSENPKSIRQMMKELLEKEKQQLKQSYNSGALDESRSYEDLGRYYKDDEDFYNDNFESELNKK